MNRKISNSKTKLFIIYSVIFCAVIILCNCKAKTIDTPSAENNAFPTQSTSANSNDSSASQSPTSHPTLQSPTPTITPTPTPTPTPIIEAYATTGTHPEDFGMRTDILVNGQKAQEYLRENKIFFGDSSEYSDKNGIFGFRGNNYRDASAVFGKQNITEAKFGKTPIWKQSTGSLSATTGGGYWSGFGWTGQVSVQEWPKSTRQIMKMYDWAKEKETLTEVIAPSQDGKIYFYEFETGKATRDPIVCNIVFKGGGSLDPRGIPLLYVGSGDISPSGTAPSAYIISLVTNEIIYEFGRYDSFAPRGWYAFDASPLVDAETDTLIYAGENGVVYFISLGTKYDENAGTLSINPNVVKWRYSGTKNRMSGKYYYGFESSPMAFQNYLYLVDNSGYLMCLDMNTLKLVWVQDVLDDTNCTGVLEVENGIPYIYMSTAYHYGWRENGEVPAPVPIFKINGQTGEIVWRTDYMCRTTNGQSGGTQGSLALGKGSLDNILYVPLAKTPSYSDGYLVALDAKTGKELWKFELSNYTWSSPSLIYDEATGKGYVIIGDVNGNLYMLDGLTGKLCDSFRLNGAVEASPVVYNNTVIIGSRGCAVYALEIK